MADGFCNYRKWETRIEMMGYSSLLSNAEITYLLTIAIDRIMLKWCGYPNPPELRCKFSVGYLPPICSWNAALGSFVYNVMSYKELSADQLSLLPHSSPWSDKMCLQGSRLALRVPSRL